MTSVDFARVRRLVELVHDLGPQLRDEVLARECGRDGALRAEVEDVLRAAGEAPQFLAPPPDSVRIDELLPEPPREAAVHAGTAFEGFRLVRRVATGGMGTVWEAEQASPRRKVALKTLRFADLSRESARRFRHESEILARLRHPNVAQVLASGVQTLPSGEALPWYAMEFVEDARTLTEFARERSLDLHARLRLFAVLCEAVQHGHERGVIHRDLKPSNVLVDGAGTLKVIDFGVARVRDRSGAFASFETETGRVIGTLQYMSPEQIAGASDGVDTRSDVYALGVILYELVTGSLPYDLAHASLATAARVLTDETPPRPSARAPHVDADLDAIVLQTLEKDRARRYATAAALAVDLARYLRGEPIDARPPSVTYQLRAFARRHRVIVGSLAAAVVTLVGAAPVGFWLAWRAKHAERAAHVSETDALAQRDEARFRAYGAEIAAAYSAVRGHDAVSARQHLERCDDDLRGFEWWLLHNRIDRSLWTRACDGGSGIATCWATDGSRLFVAGLSGAIEMLDPASGELLAGVDVGGQLTSMSIDAPARRLVASAGNELCLVDAHSLQVERRWIAHPRRTMCSAFTSAGTIVSCGYQGEVREWDPDSGRMLRELESAHQGLWCVAISADLRWIAAGASAPGDVIVWDYATGAIARRLRGHASDISCLTFDNESGLLASSSHDHTVRVWDPCSGETRAVMRGHEDIVMRATFDATGERLASGGWDRTIRLWDPQDGRSLATLFGATDNVGAIAFSPDGKRLAAVDGSSHVKLWDVAALEPDIVHVRGKWLWKLRFWPDGASVLAVHGGFAHRYATASDRVLASYPYGDAEWRGADVAPDGQRIALGDSRGRLQISTADGARTLARIETGSDALLAVDWSDDGARLAAGSAAGAVFVFEGEPLAARRLADVGARVGALAFEPRGKRIATVGPRGELRLLDGEGGALAWQSPPSFSAANDLSWSPDGQRVAVAHDDGRVLIWNVATRVCEHELIGHTATVRAVAFAPDGARIASASDDRGVRLWESATGREVANFIDHAYQVSALAFSPDGSMLASGSADSTLRWWNAGEPAQRLVASLARRLFLAREVRTALARDTSLDDGLRQRALELAAGLDDDPDQLAREAWMAVAQPRSEPDLLVDALARAQLAQRYAPDDRRATRALVLAHVRLGQPELALDEIEHAVRGGNDDPILRVVEVLALARAGRAPGGSEQINRLLEHATRDDKGRDPLLPALVAEARSSLAQ